MVQDEISQNKFVIPYEDKLPTEAPEHEEPIKVYEKVKYNNWKECFLNYWRFFAVTTAFAAIFLFIYIVMNPSIANETPKSIETDSQSENDIPVAAIPESGDVTINPTIALPPIVIDESMIGFELENEINDSYSLSALMDMSEGVKVIIIHSHNSEYVSPSLSVTDVGKVLAQILNSGGIETMHCQTLHDSNGTVAAYERMNQSLDELIAGNSSVILVIDIHDSDSGKPLTFTVGTGFEYGWRENLKLVSAISKNISDAETAIRLLPSELGQNNGILTLNVGICGKDYSDDEARKALASFARALMIICENNTPSDN